MRPYVMAEDLYQHKLAVILGRGKRLKKILKRFPTEKKFKEASLEEIANVIGIKNLNSSLLQKLKKLDNTYDQMTTFKADTRWSRLPRARKIMGIDTEYLKSKLDCIQYVLIDELEFISAGIIFTNQKIAESVNVQDGVNFLRKIINKFNPEIIVGHNFNSDISILESAYGDELPELYFYDDTMDLLDKSNLANIIGGSSLNNAVKRVFNADVIGLFSAYNDLNLLVEYGIKDALYPILLRHYIINGKIPTTDFLLTIENILKEENRSLLKNDSFKVKIDN